MSDAYTGSSLNSVQTAYDRLAYFQFRSELVFEQVATVKPTAQAMPGNPVKFTIWNDLAVATADLNESVDVDAVAITDGQVTVTLAEKGNAAITTAKLRGTSFLNVDSDVANIVGWNAYDSFDTLARTPLVAGSNVRYGGVAAERDDVDPGDTLTAALVRRSRVDLKNASVPKFADGLYRAIIHPDTAYDLRTETGEAAWRQPHLYSQISEILNGEVGSFEGFRFMESERSAIFSDAGSSPSTTDVYANLFMGVQALAKAYSTSESAERPQVVIGPVTDKLKRLHPIGWYWLGGFARFREAALRRVETASSIGDNS
jgi:N4-gp56 family major capsid protein